MRWAVATFVYCLALAIVFAIIKPLSTEGTIIDLTGSVVLGAMFATIVYVRDTFRPNPKPVSAAPATPNRERNRSTPIYKRYRVLVLLYLIQPIALMFLVGAATGHFLLFATIGVVVGIGTATTGLVGWRVARKAWRSNGFEW